MTIHQDLEVYKGADKIFRFTVKDENGIAKNLTLGTGVFRIGSLKNGTLTKSIVMGIQAPETSGIIDAEFQTADLDSVATGVYDYQAIVTDSNSDVVPISDGKIHIKALLPTA